MEEKALEEITGGDPVRGVVLGKSLVGTGNEEDGYYLLARSYGELGIYKDAMEYLKKFIEKGGSAERLDKIIGVLPEDLRKKMKPKKKEKKEGEFDGHAFLEMANLLWDIGSPDEAKQNYLRAFEAFIDEGETEGAKDVIGILKERFPNDEEIKGLSIPPNNLVDTIERIELPVDLEREAEKRLLIARAFIEEKREDDALKELEKVIFTDTPYRIKALNMAYEILKEKDRGRIIRIMEDVLNLPMTDEERMNIMYKLGLLYEEEGREKEANKMYEWIYMRKRDFMDVERRLGKKEKAEKITIEPTPPIKIGRENIEFL